MSDTNQRSAVQQLIDSRVSPDAPEVKDAEPKKFIVYIDVDTKEQLDNLSKVTRTGKINLATEILKLGVREATNAAVEAGALSPDGSLKDAAPIADPTAQPQPEAPKTKTKVGAATDPTVVVQ